MNRVYASSEVPKICRVDLAAGLLLEAVTQSYRRVGRAVLDVARPGEDVDGLALRRCRARSAGSAAGRAAAARTAAAGAPTTMRRRRERAPRVLRASVSCVPPPPSARRPSATGSACCRFQTRRTALPCCASASVEVVARFCWVTTSAAPGVERHDVAGVGPEVDDVADAAVGRDLVVADRRVRRRRGGSSRAGS